MPRLILKNVCLYPQCLELGVRGPGSGIKYDTLVLEDSKIVDIKSKAKEATSDRVVDLEGAAVFPAFVEAHAHAYGMGERLTKPRLEGRSKEAIFHLLAQIPSNLPDPGPQDPDPEPWIVSRGWDQNLWEDKRFPNRHELDSNVSQERPIALTRVDGHAMWCNTRALELAGITRETADPVGGSIERDSNGKPTGILIDEAMKLVESVIPPESKGDMERTLAAGLRYFLTKGFAAVHEMGVSRELWEVYCSLYARMGDDLPHAWVFLDMTKPTGRDLFLELFADSIKSRPSVAHARLHLAGIKLYLDGALGSRGAHLFEDYSDDSGNRGLALMEDEEVLRLMRIAAKHGLQIAVHAIGDAANARALCLFDESGASNSAATLRIEHAQIVREDDLRRFAELGVHALVQPQFFGSDRHWAVERLGSDRMRTAYRWQSLIKASASFVASSDAPIEEPDPLRGIELLTGRDGVRDGEALSLKQAVRAYCETPYRLTAETSVAGSLEAGMRADLTVVMPGIDQQVRHQHVSILATIVDGRVLYANEDSAIGARLKSDA